MYITWGKLQIWPCETYSGRGAEQALRAERQREAERPREAQRQQVAAVVCSWASLVVHMCSTRSTREVRGGERKKAVMARPTARSFFLRFRRRASLPLFALALLVLCEACAEECQSACHGVLGVNLHPATGDALFGALPHFARSARSLLTHTNDIIIDCFPAGWLPSRASSRLKKYNL